MYCIIYVGGIFIEIHANSIELEDEIKRKNKFEFIPSIV
jgi:hypothetical protein